MPAVCHDFVKRYTGHFDGARTPARQKAVSTGKTISSGKYRRDTLLVPDTASCRAVTLCVSFNRQFFCRMAKFSGSGSKANLLAAFYAANRLKSPIFAPKSMIVAPGRTRVVW